MAIFGDKWTLLIIRDLMFKRKKHFGEFTDPEENIATNILANRLKKLEHDGIVTRQRDSVSRAKFNYKLTTKGLELMPMMLDIIDWAEKHDPKTEVPKEFIRSLRRNRSAFQKRLLQGLAD